ncbi:hypothetical protein [Nocardioides speluncae]|uniref:hypothetical protein n=1 Tax=Nocardioides speluncae TaxID=2670337 RepID=UPI000D6870FB|nr:hypothetical protein [Nocardioides speluncae]
MALGAEILDDPSYVVPPVPAGARGVAWLRSQVVRFSEGTAHRRRRALTERLLDELLVNPAWHDSPTVVLAVSLGLPPAVVDDVGLVAASYQPHLPVTAEADEAVERLVEQCGGRDERTAAVICLLVQAHDATRALIEVRAGNRPAPPVPVTRRVSPDGELVEVDLTEAPFGRGRHACPAAGLATVLADAATGAGER